MGEMMVIAAHHLRNRRDEEPTCSNLSLANEW